MKDFKKEMPRLGIKVSRPCRRSSGSEPRPNNVMEYGSDQSLIFAVRGLAVRLVRAAEITQTFKVAVDTAMRVSGMDCCWIQVVDDATRVLRTEYQKRLSSEFITDFSLWAAESFHGDLVSGEGPIYFSNEDPGSPLETVACREDLTALAVLPIIHDECLVGFIGVASHSLEEIPIAVRYALEAIPLQIDVALTRIKTDESLGVSEQQYRAVEEDRTELVCRYLPDGTLTFGNEACCRYFGILNEDLIGLNIAQIIPKGEGGSLPEYLASLGPANPVATSEHKVIGPDGGSQWQRWTHRAIMNGRGAVVKFQSVGRDITERVSVSEELAESERRYRTLVETARDVVWTLDLDLRWTYVSPSVTSVLGYTVEEIMTLGHLETMTPSSRERITQLYLEDLRIESEAPREQSFSRTEQIEQYHKDGHIVWIEIITTFLRDPEGQPVGILGISRDITERKQVNQMMADFVTTAAHELKTPLTSILGFSELLLISDDISAQEEEKYLGYIRKHAKNMADLVNDLLDISRTQSGTELAKRFSLCDIKETIDELVSFHQERTLTHRFESLLPDGPIELMTDKYRIRRLIESILDNAVEYSPEGGLIRVTCESSDDYYLFSIEDQGIGMKPEQVEKAFDTFYRADASNTSLSGTGLGMTVAKSVVEEQGGKIWVESKYGKGTTVRFTLPTRLSDFVEEGRGNEENTHRG
jgi:PAS domain S-box-containing protein